MSSTRFIIGLIGLCFVALLIRWPIVDMPFERDEGEYAYIAQRWFRGEVPYRDAFDQKPPGVFVAYAVIERLVGSSPAAIHWGAQFYTLGTLVLIALIGRQFANERAGLLAALFAAFMTADRSILGNAANTELFMILPLAAGFLATVVAIDRDSTAWAVVAGVASCLAMQFKQVALQNVIFHGLLLLMFARPRLRLCVAYTVGGLAAIAPTIAYFWSVGAIREFYDCVIGHNLAYAQRVPIEDYAMWFWFYFNAILGSWWPIILLAMVSLTLRGDPAAGRPRLILATWLLFSFFGVCTGGYFRNHYFYQVIPPVAVLAGRGLTLLAEKVAPHGAGATAWAAAAAAILWGMFLQPWCAIDASPGAPLTDRVRAGVRFSPWYFCPGDPIQKVTRLYGGCPFGESPAVAAFINRQSVPDDTVYIFGSEPQICYYADRKSASRYIFAYPLMTPFFDTRGRQAGVLAELRHTRPRFIVVSDQPTSFCADDDTPKLLETEVGKLLRRSYRLVGFVDTGDTEVRPYTGQPADEPLPRPDLRHSLAIWQRLGS
jgi:hypothetical protein